ncbi:MAG: ribonuclease P protein component [Candidatus Dojkabacteria bacterium]|jgi:ribonuclease P protein component|nr:ribonuclease P protein component [Candidatus Dojkabacteria bacterium]
MLTHQHRLNAKHFKQVYNEGKKFRGEFGMLVAREYDSDVSQFAFVVSKKIGNAPERHRMTRLLRQITREILTEYNLKERNIQCQYIAFKYCDNYAILKEEYSKQLKEAFSVS